MERQRKPQRSVSLSKDGTVVFFPASAPFQERALTQNLTWFIPGKIPANGNSSQRKDKEEFREVEQNLGALRHGEVSC